MPIQKSINLDNGIQLSTAYIVINRLEFNYPNLQVTILVGIYKDSTAYTTGKPEVLSYNHRCTDGDFTTYFAESVLDDADKTPLIQGYQWLLTLPLYSGGSLV